MGQISSPTKTRSPTEPRSPTKTKLHTKTRSPRKLNIDSKLKAFKNKKMINKILNHLVSNMNVLIKKMEESDKKNDKIVLSNLKQFLEKDGERFGLKMESGELKHINIKTSLQKGGATPEGDDTQEDDAPEYRLTNTNTNTNSRNPCEDLISQFINEEMRGQKLTDRKLALFKNLLEISRDQQDYEDRRRREQCEWITNQTWEQLNRGSKVLVGVGAYYGAHNTLQLANGLIGPITSLVGSFCSLIFISFFGAIADGINGITSKIPFYGGDAVPRPQDILNEILDEAMLNDNAEGFAGIIQTLEQAGEGGYYLSLMVLFFFYLGIFSIAYQIWNSNDFSMFWGFFRVRRNVQQGPETRTRTRSRSTPSNEGRGSKRKTKKIKKNKTRNRKNKRKSKKLQKNKRRSKNRKQSKKKKRKAKK